MKKRWISLALIMALLIAACSVFAAAADAQEEPAAETPEPPAQEPSLTEKELTAYRRAEQTERNAAGPVQISPICQILLRRLPRPEPRRILPQPRKPRLKFRRNHVIGCFSRFRAHFVRKDRSAVIIEQKAYIDAPRRLLQNFRIQHIPLPKLPIPFVPIARGQLQCVICPQRARLPRN